MNPKDLSINPIESTGFITCLKSLMYKYPKQDVWKKLLISLYLLVIRYGNKSSCFNWIDI